MHPLARLLQVMGYAAIAGVVVALVAAVLRRWSLSLTISRTVAWCGLGLSVLIVSVYLFNPQLPSGVEVEPAQSARVYAETLSEVLGCAAFAFTGALPSLPIAVFASWRLRLARGQADSPPQRATSLPEKVVLLATAGVALLATAVFYFSPGGYLHLLLAGFPALALGYVVLTGQKEPQLPAQLFLVAELLAAALWGSAPIVAALLVLPAIPLGVWNAWRRGGSALIAWYVHLAALVSAGSLVWQAAHLARFVR